MEPTELTGIGVEDLYTNIKMEDSENAGNEHNSASLQDHLIDKFKTEIVLIVPNERDNPFYNPSLHDPLTETNHDYNFKQYHDNFDSEQLPNVKMEPGEKDIDLRTCGDSDELHTDIKIEETNIKRENDEDRVCYNKYVNQQDGMENEQMPEDTENVSSHNEIKETAKTNTQIDHAQHVCDVCNKEFTKSSDLSRHKLVHTGEIYECKICYKGFTQFGDLITHNLIHSKHKPYVCEVCNKGFNYASRYTSHRRIHMREKLYVCEICNKRFTQLASLKAHRRVHTGEKPYECDICKKKFAQTSNLVTHKRIHTGEKPYVCNVCNKKFNHSSHMKIHKRIHTKDKPDACEFCNKLHTIGKS